jgi:hypothetical protein
MSTVYFKIYFRKMVSVKLGRDKLNIDDEPMGSDQLKMT